MKITQQICTVLAGALISDNRLQIKTRLDRETYIQTSKVLEALGGKWNRKAQAHVFEGDPNDAIAAAIASGEVVDWKREFQFFETPPELAERMVAEGLRGQTILEPSAGNGAILDAIRRLHPKEYENRFALHVFEINPRCQAALVAKHPGIELLGADFLQYATSNSYDSVLMNPPFNHGQDIRHVRHAYEMLRPGGRLTTITSPGWTFRQDRAHREFRAWMDTLPTHVEELPHGTFKTSGTMIRATLLVIDKEYSNVPAHPQLRADCINPQ